MKKLLVAAFICGLAYSAYAQGLPRLAVVAFTTNVSTAKIQADAATIRKLVESRMVASGKYQVISREEIDKLLENQRIQVSSISSKENITKLQLQNISYMVTGSVNAMDSDYLITVKILDVSTGQFSYSADEFMGGSSRELINGVSALVSKFIAEESGRKEYKIGDIGPAGGIVFYDKGAISDGWRYLEAAPAGTEFRAQWGAYENDVAGTNTWVGSGKRNTQIIVERLRQFGESGRTAQLCAGLDFNGYKDWFLPSRDELYLMYQNLKRKGLGGFSDDFYWSSSQDGIYGALPQHFSGITDYLLRYHFKDNSHSVRAARAF
jgi:TolB-like protein